MTEFGLYDNLKKLYCSFLKYNRKKLTLNKEVGMLGLIKELLEKRREQKKVLFSLKKKEGLFYECADCGAKDGFLLKPVITLVQFQKCGHCGQMKAFVIENKKIFIRFN